MTGPLAGIRVVDLGQIVSGPMAACILADQGADVIKVETPGGDPVRGLGPKKGDLSSMFITVNRGKRGIALDLKQPAGCAVLRDLIARADVLLENFRPGAIERLGFGYAACRTLNPRLIFASINGFGPDGPYANIRTYDFVVQAIAGLAATQTDRDGRPGLIRSLIADKVTALTAAQAITAALFARERTGVAQRVDVAMLDAALQFNWPDSMYNHVFLDDAPGGFPDYGAMMRLWVAADGQVAIGALQTAEFVALVRAAGLPALAADERFQTMAGRVAHQQDWTPQLAAALKAADLDTLMAGFIREGAVGGRVNSLDQVIDDPQVRHNGALIEFDHGPEGRVRAARPAPRFAASGTSPLRPAPHIGQHSRDILGELGRTGAEIAALLATGAVLAAA